MENYQEQHAIPQQISAYEFHLVGDMTLKQFFQLAAGALVSLVLYATTLPAIVKWPLIIVSFLTGVAIAFFPLEGRPLEKWIFLFAKSIYSPTLFVWDKSKAVKTYFKPEDPSTQLTVKLPPSQDDTIEQQAQLAPAGHKEESKASLKNLEENEAEFLANTSSLLNSSPSTIEYKEPPIVGPVTREVEIPETQNIEVEKVDDKEKEGVVVETEKEIQSEVTPSETQEDQSVQQVQFSPEAAPPNPPTTPNIIVGQVLENSGKIIDAAILEVKDDLGRPTRAVKTNKLGHFQIVTPLVDGKYTIITEKDGYKFDTVKFEAKGEIIPPIVIKGDVEESSTNENNIS